MHWAALEELGGLDGNMVFRAALNYRAATWKTACRIIVFLAALNNRAAP